MCFGCVEPLYASMRHGIPKMPGHRHPPDPSLQKTWCRAACSGSAVLALCLAEKAAAPTAGDEWVAGFRNAPLLRGSAHAEGSKTAWKSGSTYCRLVPALPGQQRSCWRPLLPEVLQVRVDLSAAPSAQAPSYHGTWERLAT